MNSPSNSVALVAAGGVAGIATFQILLAVGLPLGRAPRSFGVFGHPCAKGLMCQGFCDTIPSKLRSLIERE
jgi:hypothetical protein